MLDQLDLGDAVPLYQQLADTIRSRVANGKYERNAQIPTEALLSQEFGVSRITVRKALEELVEDGLLVRRQGKGTFVASEKAIHNQYPFTAFNESCRAAGRIPSTKLLSYSIECPTKKQIKFLNISETDKVIKIRRLRIADEIPVILETDLFLNEFSFLAEEPLTESVDLVLRKRNIFSIHGESTTSICFATAEESELLNIESETPLLYVYSEIKDQNMRPIQISKQIIRSDLYQLVQIY